MDEQQVNILKQSIIILIPSFLALGTAILFIRLYQGLLYQELLPREPFVMLGCLGISIYASMRVYNWHTHYLKRLLRLL